jgi:hypothetical protein
MFGFRYLKTSPTTYVLQYRGGRLVREGTGLAFWYFAPSSVMVNIPLATVDVPFMFGEVTSDFQSVTVQGQLTYRVKEPTLLAGLLDFSVNFAGQYRSDDPRKLDDRLIRSTQVFTSGVIHQMTLRDVLVSQPDIAMQVTRELRNSEAVTMLGLEVLTLSVIAIKPSPDTAKALEADARETLLRHADEAIYARRNSAVEQERLIKESELNTELAVEEKRRQIREKKMSADIANEQQRLELIDQQVQNDQKQADSRGYALEAVLKPLRATDWRILQSATAGQMDSAGQIAQAFREIAANAEKIGELHISPELLASLAKKK